MAPDNPLHRMLNPTATDGSPLGATGITSTAEPMADLLKRLRPAGTKGKARGQTGGFGRARWRRPSVQPNSAR